MFEQSAANGKRVKQNFIMAVAKPLKHQVVVITGASSGIGLATARLAADAGAKVVLCARGEEGLRKAASEIAANGGEAALGVCRRWAGGGGATAGPIRGGAV